MRNFIQKGETITVPSPVAAASGDIVIIGGFHGVAAGDAAIGADLDLCLTGVYEAQKVAADAFAVGDPVYFNAATKLVTSTEEGNTFIGYAVAVAAVSTANTLVRLSN